MYSVVQWLLDSLFNRADSMKADPRQELSRSSRGADVVASGQGDRSDPGRRCSSWIRSLRLTAGAHNSHCWPHCHPEHAGAPANGASTRTRPRAAPRAAAPPFSCGRVAWDRKSSPWGAPAAPAPLAAAPWAPGPSAQGGGGARCMSQGTKAPCYGTSTRVQQLRSQVRDPSCFSNTLNLLLSLTNITLN